MKKLILIALSFQLATYAKAQSDKFVHLSIYNNLGRRYVVDARGLDRVGPLTSDAFEKRFRNVKTWAPMLTYMDSCGYDLSNLIMAKTNAYYDYQMVFKRR